MSAVHGDDDNFNANPASIFVHEVNELRSHLEMFDAQNTAHWLRLSALVQSFLLAKFQELPMNVLEQDDVKTDLTRIDTRLAEIIQNLREVRLDPLNDDAAKLNSLNKELILLDSRLISLNSELNLLPAEVDSNQELLNNNSFQADQLAVYQQHYRLNQSIRRKQSSKDAIAYQVGELYQQIAQQKELIANREKAMKDEIDQITQHKDQIATQVKAIVAYVNSLRSGTFFSPIDNVWIAEMTSFEEENDERTTFNRTTHVNNIFFNEEDHRYQNTAEGAFDSKHDVALDSTRSPSLSKSATGRKKGEKEKEKEKKEEIDIFGRSHFYVPSAHLMPHADSCSRFWFIFVPWILYLIPTNYLCVTWDVLQKCIHGFFVKRDANSASTKNTTTDEKSSGTNTANEVANKKTIDEANTNPPKVDYVGIKYFPTNHVFLQYQSAFFDDYPHVLIVPVMTVQQATKWNGDSYYAIVLAGECKVSTTKVSEVYEKIGAGHGGGGAGDGVDFLATMVDLETARSLLETMLVSVAQSMKFNYCQDSSALKIGLRAAVQDASDSVKHAFEELEKENKIPVPKFVVKDRGSEIKINVRKIFFSSRLAEDKLSAKFPAAPDPILLLAKAASNWLRRQDILWLPGCDDAEASLDSVTIEEECVACGWYVNKRPRITEIDIDCRTPGTCVDDNESLSGSET